MDIEDYCHFHGLGCCESEIRDVPPSAQLLISTYDKLGTGLCSTLHPPTSSHNTSHLHLHINYQHILHSSLEDLCYSRILGLFLEHIVTGVRLLVGI
jgi:hypothetical protein